MERFRRLTLYRQIALKILLVVTVGLGGNIFFTDGIDSNTLSNVYSGLSITPVLFIAAMMLIWQLPKRITPTRIITGAVSGLIVNLLMNAVGYMNVGPFVFENDIALEWRLLGFIAFAVIGATMASVDVGKVNIQPSVNWLAIPAGFVAGVFLTKPFLINPDVINWETLLRSNWIDGVLLSLIIVLLGLIQQDTRLKTWQNLIIGLISVVLTVFYTFGISIDLKGDDTFAMAHPMFYFVGGIALFIFSFVLIKYILILSAERNHTVAPRKLSWKLLVVLTILAWLPYVLLFMPGSLGYDGMNQLAEFFRIHAADGTNFYPTNHQPWFATLLMGSVVKFGMTIFGTFATGVGFYDILVTIFGVYTTVRMAVFVSEFRGAFWGWTTWAIAALMPIFPFWYMTFDKTGLFILMFAWFLMSFVKVSVLNSQKVSDFIGFSIWGALLALFRNDMVYVLALTLIVLILIKKSARVKTAVSLLIIIGVAFSWNSIALKKMDIVPSPSAEMLSVPIQQLARSYYEHPEEFSAKERRQLKQAFSANGQSLNQVMVAYNYGLSDLVKGEVTGSDWIWRYSLAKNDQKREKQLAAGQESQKKSVSLILKVWKANISGATDSYIVATFSNVYHYVYPLGINHGNGYRLTWNGNTATSDHFRSSLTKDYDYWWQGESVTKARNLDVLLHTSVVGLLLVAGTWGTILIVAAGYALIWFDKRAFTTVLLFVGMFGVNFLGPVDGGLRYVFPLILGMPVMFAVLSLGKYKK